MDASSIAGAFGLGRARVLSDGPVARGKEGAVWCLETTEGRWAVKVLRRASTEEALAPTVELQEAAHAAGVLTPQVRRTTDGAVLADLGGQLVRVHAWIDLGEPDDRLDPEVVGATLAALHQVALPAPEPIDPWYCEPVGAAGWDDLVGRLRRAGAPFAAALADLRDEVVALERWISPPQRVQRCHRDLWADNLRPTRGGVCVIDWDNAGPADPAQELACSLFEFARTDPGRARSLVAAYVCAGGPARLQGSGDFSMLVAQLGHITQAAAEDWLTPSERSPRREDAEAWVRESLDDPHSRQRLTALLATARDAQESAADHE